MKFLIIAILVIALGAYLFINNLRSTPHGKLNLAEALFLKYVFKAPNRLEKSVEAQRKEYRYFSDKFPEPHVEVYDVSDQQIPGPVGDIPIRIYKPSAQTNLPILVYYHGGGWVIGDLETHDSVCRNLCHQAGVIVVSVDYRLAPEHKFPVPFDDCYTATEWVAAHANAIGGDARRIAIGGDSAGGNLAAAISLKARDESGPSIKYQLLIYPATDGSRDTQSKIDFVSGYLLSKHGLLESIGLTFIGE